ncbi:MAG TPA: HNH endonuclease signature motif containing protein, partial [Mycobacterium sp.]|nr:HNH endonuclease signature motif containing protein [Mycobacterium sp.]
LAEFVRCRDLACRFPGCEQAAEFCDIDHTVPYQLGGLTHPSNLKLLCRFHHLLKTFYTGAGGWADKQSPDGTVVWTSPSRRTYTTKPGGSLFFPILATPTGEVSVRKLSAELGEGRGLMMPRRRRTREEERQERITAERRINEQCLRRRRLVFEELLRYRESRESPGGDEPPPF